jgi:hypothetical protein
MKEDALEREDSEPDEGGSGARREKMSRSRSEEAAGGREGIGSLMEESLSQMEESAGSEARACEQLAHD